MYTITKPDGSLYFVGEPKACLEVWKQHPTYLVREGLLTERKRLEACS